MRLLIYRFLAEVYSAPCCYRFKRQGPNVYTIPNLRLLVRAPMSHTRLYIVTPLGSPETPMNILYATSTLHPIGQPGELFPAGPHAELLFMVGVERRAGARGGDQSLHLVRVRVRVRARVQVLVRVKVRARLDRRLHTSAHGTARLAMSHAITMAVAPASLSSSSSLTMSTPPSPESSAASITSSTLR